MPWPKVPRRLCGLAPPPTPQVLASIEDVIPDTPNERLKQILDEASALVHGNDEYLRACTSDPSTAADALENKTRTANWKELATTGKTMFEFRCADLYSPSPFPAPICPPCRRPC